MRSVVCSQNRRPNRPIGFASPCRLASRSRTALAYAWSFSGSSNTAAARISGVPSLMRSRRSGITGGFGSSLVRSCRILSAVASTLDSTSDTVRRPSSRPVRLMVSSTSMRALRRSW